jgi:hypothetical protein
MERETLALVIPPTTRLIKNIKNKLENDQTMYEMSVPNFLISKH